MDIRQAFKEAGIKQQRLKRADFDVENGVANQRQKIASYKAKSPIAFREASLRLAFVVVEQFQTNGTGGDTETFSLSNDVLDTANTSSFALYESGNPVQADTVDYDADTFDYTDDGTSNYLHAAYVARDPVQIDIEKSAPSGAGQVSQPLFDDVTSMLHERNQNKSPPSMQFNSVEESVVPRNWSVDIYADGPVALAWDDSDTANPQGIEAVNPVVSLPIIRAKQNISGLSRAVKRDILESGNG